MTDWRYLEKADIWEAYQGNTLKAVICRIRRTGNKTPGFLVMDGHINKSGSVDKLKGIVEKRLRFLFIGTKGAKTRCEAFLKVV